MHPFLLFSLAAISMIGASFGDKEVERGNAYVDKLLVDIIENQVEKFDPYYMEDSVSGFFQKIAFVNVSGVAKWFNGRITGLRTLHRAENCSLSETGDRIHVRSKLGVGVLYLYYEGAIQFMNFGPTIQVHGEIHYVEAAMNFSVDAATGKDGVLHEFTVDDLRNMKVWITGLGPLNWLVNPLLQGVTKIFKTKLKNMVERKVELHIRQRLPGYQFPVEDIGDEKYINTMKTSYSDIKKKDSYTMGI